MAAQQLGDEVQRAFVGPVQVVEHHHQGQAIGQADASQVLGRGVEGARAHLGRVFEDAAQVRAVAEINADQVAEQVGVRLRQSWPVVGLE